MSLKGRLVLVFGILIALLGVLSWRWVRVPEGRTLEVRMVDEGGTIRFEPSEITARRGDVIRFIQGPHRRDQWAA
jgi:hypothetical protein